MNMTLAEQPVWEDEIFVRSYDVDNMGKLRLSSLFNYFQETAGKHATHLGAGYGVLQRLGLFWVLSRTKVRIHRLPSWGESIRLTTWPKGLDGLLFLRDFLLTSDQNELLVESSTGWLLLDSKAYKPHLPDALPTTLPPNPRGHALEEQLKKIRPFDDLKMEYERKVLASDLDVNNHVNNARYIDWIMDCYAPNAATSKTVHAMQVNYVGETTFGDVIHLYKGEDASSGTHYIEGVNGARGARVVQAAIEWKIENRP
jgi:medium-chain acyl-[acyl-carrier-protein] hydrolase